MKYLGCTGLGRVTQILAPKEWDGQYLNSFQSEVCATQMPELEGDDRMALGLTCCILVGTIPYISFSSCSCTSANGVSLRAT